MLRNLEDSLDSYCELSEEGKTAFRMAIEALSSSEIPNNSDCISRQAAIEAVNNLTYPSSLVDVKRKLIELPPAQSEIIRCKDCKHRDPEDKKCDCGHDIVWQLPRDDDWYCADAERKEVTT